MRSFASDYDCKPHPAVMKAVVQAMEAEPSGVYGQDRFTREATELLKERFGATDVLFVNNGTSANRLALKSLLNRPFHCVISTECSHINVHECGAIESLGHKILPTPDHYGKIHIGEIERRFRQRNDIHMAYPWAVSISNATEFGTVYSYEELHAIGQFGLPLHIDGARMANAVAHLDHKKTSLRKMISNIGVSTISFGCTKNGGMMGDAVLFFGGGHAPNSAVWLHKQQGQLCARMHVIAAQVIALFKNDLWMKNARDSNAMASLLAERCINELDLHPVYPVESNVVFVQLPKKTILKMLQETRFYVWDGTAGIVRWMCSWDTTEKDVDELITLVKKCL